MLTPAAVAGTPVAEVAAGITPAQIHEGPMGEAIPRWRAAVDAHPRAKEMWAYSPSMDRWVPLVVLPAQNPNRPTVYALNGGDGGEGRLHWVGQTDILDFYAEKDVNLVIPMAGAFSYYSDWVAEEPRLGGKQMWETFVTKELPQGIESHLGANGQRAIFGMSMSATTVLNYAQHQPGFYDAVGSFSGCAQTSKDAGFVGVFATMARAGILMENMWGPLGGPTWHYNDALENASKLRGTPMYISTATGLAGEDDLWSGERVQGNSANVGILVVEGGGIEAVTNKCTHDLKAKLDSEGIGADWAFRPVGTHSWPYWQEDLRGSWETFRVAFGM
ncbi:Diacylglycerol acyltransferase/mycolyltransferase Ag85A precursor [Corynebacterium kalinowskii]|uniref:Diacylglycerol acyltransferase/mycolyltransferase Ag85A n=2 Tax=Corynebacterium kalinowskii TaxID=2675216 RepID=A0A6B8VWD3_9CORY|nr:Diacylglycerol acyltransferase/mycolyltransferase Ag85A precursor [Corynebacterium kalinowskii]